MPPMPPRSTTPIPRSGFVPLLVHEAYASEAITAWLTATAPEAFDRTLGTRGDDQPWGSYRVANGVALIPVLGTLIPRGLFMGSGYVTSYEMLVAELRRAGADPAVDSVALMIDSPGGYVSNLDAAAAAVVRLRAEKPVTAYVQGMACSAAYWLAAACDEVVCSPQSEMGSIGVLQAHFDMSGLLEQVGVKVTLVFAGAKKVDGNPYEPLSDRVKAEMTRRLEDLRMAFAQAVAAGRPSLDVAAVLATEAATFVGADAVARGLADRIGYLADDLPDTDDPLILSPTGRFMETTMNYTQAQLDQAVTTARTTALTEGKTAGIEEGRIAGHATGKAEGLVEGLAAGKAEGLAAGAVAERDRVKAIMGGEPAKKRPTAAAQVALATDMTSEKAATFLAALPEETASAGADTLDAEMTRDRQPILGADGKPAAKLNDEQSKFEEGRATALRLQGKPAK